MRKKFQDLLERSFQGDFVEVWDVSNQHAGHEGISDRGETHFLITIRSRTFSGMSVLEKHRCVLNVLGEEASRVHSISMDLGIP